MSPNEGYAAGIGTRSPIQRLAWALKGAPLRKKDMMLSPLGAVAEGRKLRDSLSAKLRQSSLDPNAAAVFIAFAKPDFTALSEESMKTLIPVGPDHDSEVVIAARNGRNIPIGFVVLLRDESEGIFGHVRPLLIDPRSLKLNEQALSVFLRVVGSKLLPDQTN